MRNIGAAPKTPATAHGVQTASLPLRRTWPVHTNILISDFELARIDGAIEASPREMKGHCERPA